MLQQQYQLTKQIHAIIPELAKKYGKEIGIKNDKILYLDINDETNCKEVIIGGIYSYVDEFGYLMSVKIQEATTSAISYNFVSKIEAPQIRQVLLALFSDWHYKDIDSIAKPTNCTFHTRGHELEKKWFCFRIDFIDGQYITHPSLFDREPVTVLTEFLAILENLNNQ